MERREVSPTITELAEIYIAPPSSLTPDEIDRRIVWLEGRIKIFKAVLDAKEGEEPDFEEARAHYAANARVLVPYHDWTITLKRVGNSPNGLDKRTFFGQQALRLFERDCGVAREFPYFFEIERDELEALEAERKKQQHELTPPLK